MQTVSKLQAGRASAPRLSSACTEVKRFQAQRFAATYADLLQSPRYRRAAHFFLTELYGDQDYGQRDQQFSRIANTITRLFPDAVSDTAATLAEVHALTEQLDEQMARQWLASKLPAGAPRYVACWRSVGDQPARRAQLKSVLHLGDELDQLTQAPGLRRLLKMMRAPASLAGLSSLQRFLESGFDAFADMKGASEFLASVEKRESVWIKALFEEDTVACETKLQELLVDVRLH